MHKIQKRPPKKSTHGINAQLLSLAVPIGSLVPDPKNARDHDDRNTDSIVLSYKEHGQRKPIVVQEREDGELVIRAGNGQHQAAQRLGWTHIAAVIVDEADAEAVTFAIRDNRTAELAVWNLPNLSDQLQEIKGWGTPLEEIGFESYEYEPIIGKDWGNNGDDGDGDGGVILPEKRVKLMFTRPQWEELKSLLEARPSADLVLQAIKGEK